MGEYVFGNLTNAAFVQFPESIILAPRTPDALSTILEESLAGAKQVLGPLSKAHIRPLLSLSAHGVTQE
jgi:hypothetical protein